MVGARIADRLIGLASTVILARLLTPADFGLVAMAMSVIGLIEVASGFGFEVSLVRTAKPTRAQYDTVWTLNLAFGLACSAIVALAAQPTAEFYNDHRLVHIMWVLAGSWTLASFGNVGIVDFQRTLNFGQEFRFLVVSRTAGFLVTVIGAFLTHSYWALIAGTVATRGLSLILSYAWHPFRPRLRLSASREIFSFSVWIFVSRLAAFGNTRASDFVLGRFRGASELGIYRMGEDIGHLPGTEFVAPLNRALLPGVSQMIEAGRSTGELVISATGVIALLLFPACLGISAVADPLVRIMLGPGWVDAIPVVRILSINALALALWGNQHTTMIAIGRPEVPAVISIGRLLVFAPILIFLTRDLGAQGVAIAALVSSASALVAGLGMSLARVGVRVREYLRVILRPLLGALIMWAVVMEVGAALEQSATVESHAMRLAVEVILGIAVYATAVWLLFLASGKPEGPERLLFDRVAPSVGRLFGLRD